MTADADAIRFEPRAETLEPRTANARTIFVVGKGGVGKTTHACRLALDLANAAHEAGALVPEPIGTERAGAVVHLISTDPAHSLADFFGQTIEPGRIVTSQQTAQLHLEEFAAGQYTASWLERARPAVAELVEHGTWLDASDAETFLDRAIPGVDEVMAAFRIAELDATAVRHIVVDTAPTGHLLRLLDAEDVVETWVDALDAMAARAAAVSTALVGSPLPLTATTLIAEWRAAMQRFRTVIENADFVVITRRDAVVEAETTRLLRELQQRRLHVAAVVEGGSPTNVSAAGQTRPRIGTSGHAADSPPPSDHPSALRWLSAGKQRILFFAGKGGVGKSTCACAAAATLARRGPVLLLSIDPAGSLGDVYGTPVGETPVRLAPNLFARQLDAPAALARWRENNRERIERMIGALGLAGGARLDHQVLSRVLDLAPPGLDELVAFSEILDAAEGEQTVVVDAAPTGHFLRLLAMPDAATDWAHAAMRLILKYRAVAALEEAARDLLDFARQARGLRELLCDQTRTAMILVSLPEPMVMAETWRLQAALENATIPPSAILFNRTDAGPNVPRSQAREGLHTLRAPDVIGGITGPEGLLRFVNSWELLD